MTIAVLIPTIAGRDRLLNDALASLDRQSEDYRVLLYGDGFTPDPPASGHRVHFAPCPIAIRQGEAVSRNALLHWWQCTLPFFDLACWMDDDDLAHPERLATQARAMREHQDWDVCFADIGAFEDGWEEHLGLAQGQPIYRPYWPAFPDRWVRGDYKSLFGAFTGPTAMFRPSVCQVPFRTAVTTGGTDLLWYYELFMRGYRFGAVHQQLYYLRQHEGRLTKQRNHLLPELVTADLDRFHEEVAKIHAATMVPA